jgi:histidine phosphotransfer protein HptB
MAQIQNCSRSAHVDLQELLGRLDNDYELLRDLLTIFKTDFPRLVEAIEEAIARQDMKEIMKSSHTLKGMLSNLAVTKGAEAAGRVERIAQEGTMAAVQEAFAAFRLEVQGLLPEMETYMAEVRP